jgi:proteasome lid subunit RPN8/RPN11
MNKQLTNPTPVLEIDSEVARAIRQHARSSMNQEICGVLVGTENGSTTIISSRIEGKEASQGGAHVTFTQETWNHIYKVKDARFPNDKIVGWYHSHPGFGVFLSEYDLFIQQNFFNAKHQVAWVFYPQCDQVSGVGWVGEKIARLENITVVDTKAKIDTTPKKEPENVNPHSWEGDSGKASKLWNWLAIVYLGAAFLGGLLVMFAAERYFPEYFPHESTVKAISEGRDIQWNSKDIAEGFPGQIVKFRAISIVPTGPTVSASLPLPGSLNPRGVAVFELIPTPPLPTSPEVKDDQNLFPSAKTSSANKSQSK